MRPTIDEQLDGVQHLLDVAVAESELTPASVELLTNARRLLKQIGRSWAALPAFYEQDNAAMSALLEHWGTGSATPAKSGVADVRAAAEQNAELRSQLSGVIAGLADGPDGDAARRALLSYLTHRVDVDPS